MTHASYILEKLGECCSIFESKESKERRERRKMLLEGCTFKRKKTTLGFDFGATEMITLKLNETEDELSWFVIPQVKGSSSGSIRIDDISGVGSKAPSSLAIMSTSGENLLEIDAETSALRDEWALALNEAVPKRSDADLAMKGPSTLSGRAAKQAYFMQKNMELSSKKQEAEKRKQKYLQSSGGLKYTALAMASKEDR